MAEKEFDAGRIGWRQATRTTTSSTTNTTIFDDDSPSQNSGFDVDWNQSLQARSNSVSVEPSFDAMLQEPSNYQHQQQLLGLQGGQFEPQRSIFDPRLMNCDRGSSYHGSSSDFLTKLPEFLKSSSPSSQPSTFGSNLQFSKNAEFWPPTPPVLIGAQSYVQRPSCSVTTMLNLDGALKKSGSSNGESTLKRPRIYTISPLPAFKVRKEKLGDRVTALQQLVSPFAKTDTASVLHEALEYIKFLHEQVSVLTNPYLSNGHPIQDQQISNEPRDGEGQKQDLRSRGLCLVPVENTYTVASETVDFWTPIFGRTYR